jgi:threonine dehydrogenase-like Zn-dependent dehydrogenase
MSGLPSSSRAAAVVHRGCPLEIVEVSIPDRLEPGALLVKTDAATVCGTDVHVWQSTSDPGGGLLNELPVILGHEMTGRIVQFADGPRTDSVGQGLSEGDRIVWTHGYCGRCLECTVERQPSTCRHRRRYMSERCDRYPFLTGGFSEYCYVFPTSGRVKVPEQLSDGVASASSCALRTIIQAFERLGPIEEHQTVLLQGSGPLGLFGVAKAATSGAAQVISMGGPRARLEIAQRWGATLVIDVDETTDSRLRREMVMDVTRGRGADVVVEVSGAAAAFNEGLDLLRPGGRYLIVGQAHSETVAFNPSLIVSKQARLIGSLSAGVEHYWRALEFLCQHRDRFNWDEMLSATYQLEDINTAFDRMASWQEVKPAIVFG